MENESENMKFVGIAKEIEELLAALSNHYKLPEQESEVRKTYEKPNMLEINQTQYKKFKTIMFFVHTFCDGDNDTIDYNCSIDGLDVTVVWRTPSVYLSKSDQSISMFAKVLNLADNFGVTVTGLDEITISLTVNGVMKKIDKGNLNEGV